MPTYSVTVPNGKVYTVEAPNELSDDHAWAAVVSKYPDALAPKASKNVTYKIKAPDGNTYTIEGPDGATDEQVAQVVLMQNPAAGVPPAKSEAINELKRGATARSDDLADVRQTLQTTSSVEQTPLHTKNVDRGEAYSHAAIQTVAGMAIAVAVHWLLARRLWKKPRTTPHELGYWWGTWVGCLQLGLTVGKFTGSVLYGTVSDNDYYLLAMNGVVVAGVFGLFAYVVGWLFRRFLKPFQPLAIPNTDIVAAPSQQDSQNAASTVHHHADNDHFAHALSELEGGNLDRGLWARCFAEADGNESKVKANYLRQRASDLAISTRLGDLRESVIRKDSNFFSNKDGRSMVKFLQAFLAIALWAPSIFWAYYVSHKDGRNSIDDAFWWEWGVFLALVVIPYLVIGNWKKVSE